MKFSLVFVLFCSLNLLGQGWEQMNDIPSVGRDDAVSFSILGLGYIVTGNMPGGESNQLWCFDANTNSWTEKKVFPGQERQYAGAFVLEGKAYIMCGYSSAGLPLKDVWQYDPEKDDWQQMKDFGGAARWTFFQFTAENFGFIGAGASPDSSLADCWRYDPRTDDWTRVADYPEGRMREVLGVSIGDRCFAGTGFNINPLQFSNKFFEYNWQSDEWKAISDFPGSSRGYVGGVGVGTRAIIGGGWGQSSDFKTDFYVLTLDGNWKASASAPIQGWRGMSTFSSNGSAYFLSGLYADVTRTSNVFRLTPIDEYVPILFPNPSNEKSYLYFLPNRQVKIYDLKSNLVSSLLTDYAGYCRLPQLASGEYIIRIENTSATEYALRWLVQ